MSPPKLRSAEEYTAPRRRGMGFMLFLLSALVITTTLAVENAVPSTVGIGFLYTLLVLISLWSSRRAHTFVAAFVGTGLVIAGHFISKTGGDEWLGLANRGLAVYAIWMTAFLCLWQKRWARNQRLVLAAKRQAEERSLEMEAQRAELEQANQALRKTKAEAEAAAMTMSQFLANMSHEIRTPMTAILGFTESLSEERLSGDESIESIEIIRENGEHLLQIINDILDISKIEAGMLQAEILPCSPAQIIERVLSTMHPRAAAKGIDLVTEYRSRIPETILTDPTRLRQILINLVGNAIKFTDEGAVRVDVQWVERGPARPHLVVEVTDSGPGMTPEQQQAIFQPFRQADSSTTRNYGGTGLGLTISQQLAAILGGEISCRSVEGEGSTFCVTIEAPLASGMHLLNLIATALKTPEETTGADDGNDEDLTGVRLLLAEDTPTNQLLISRVLEKAGATVEIVENGMLAVDRTLEEWRGEQPFHVVLMDMQMPVLDGYEATRRLRAVKYNGRIIALTAHSLPDDRAKCIEAGCNDYATKPIERLRLLSAIRRAVEAGPSAAPSTAA